jgi:hypothetical protein
MGGDLVVFFFDSGLPRSDRHRLSQQTPILSAKKAKHWAGGDFQRIDFQQPVELAD